MSKKSQWFRNRSRSKQNISTFSSPTAVNLSLQSKPATKELIKKIWLYPPVQMVRIRIYRIRWAVICKKSHKYQREIDDLEQSHKTNYFKPDLNVRLNHRQMETANGYKLMQYVPNFLWLGVCDIQPQTPNVNTELGIKI